MRDSNAISYLTGTASGVRGSPDGGLQVSPKWADVGRQYIKVVKGDLQFFVLDFNDQAMHSDSKETRANPPHLWVGRDEDWHFPYDHYMSRAFRHEFAKQRGEPELFRQTHVLDETIVSQVAEDAQSNYSKGLGWGPKLKACKTTSASSSTTSCLQSTVELQLQAKLD
ncbi:CACTA en-spm transposon protein [Cucumis melo var. makuwa]|uniref:CACTA en-spm transposon protein n=1 Tax=Cucumis melo var. makuwa TaxID=1194695 RepID=A0A5A7U9X1_CUCMM|nr:CACTA en-spm transposon protein [Cucumis melo var. makuwa]TYK04523.1 CACTA en-spm transposon protein [Cucumis melo var. makuwa]